MKLSSISLTAVALAAVAGSVIAAPRAGPFYYARALEDDEPLGDLFKRQPYPNPARSEHHEKALKANKAAHESAGVAYDLSPDKGIWSYWKVQHTLLGDKVGELEEAHHVDPDRAKRDKRFAKAAKNNAEKYIAERRTQLEAASRHVQHRS